jgi:beta-glucosidase/6-phospho-beta-glucosidase/beta-galactosidase
MPRVLGLLVAPAEPALAWWVAGLALHLLVGTIGAIFYAYFFWTMFPLRPAGQGLVFGLIGAVIVISVVYPLLMTLHADQPLLRTTLLELAAGVSGRERIGLVLGHGVYGLVLGALYTRPVGRRVDRPVDLPALMRRASSVPVRKARTADDAAFIFATGIECSYVTLEGGRWRLDQMEATEHYRRWQRDLEAAVEIGVTHLRYGPPLHLVYQGPDRYDWCFTDAVMARMQAMGLVPIVDLCHFGLPAWLGDFQNDAVPEALRDYAAAFARRYPWVRYYTPVNEMYVCARLSALDGLWNEQRRDERSFVTAVRHLARANSLMCRAILQERPDAVMVFSESGEFYQPCCPDPEIVRKADFENERRFLPLDLLFAHPVSDGMRRYLAENGMPDDEYEWFMQPNLPKRSILGVDYYEWNERLIDSNGTPQALGELFGWFVIANQYWERYRLPMMHTETNRMDARDAPHWLWRQWHNVELIRKAGVPVVGFTWYSLTDQVDWDIAQREALGNVNPVGLFDLNREARPVGQAYKHLIDTFCDQPEIRCCQPLRDLLA